MKSEVTGDTGHKYNFINEIIEKNEEKSEEANPAFKVGYALGVILVTSAVVSLEAVFFSLLLLAFGLPFSFLQGLSIAIAVQLLSLKFKSNG